MGRKSPIYGFGINDYEGTVWENRDHKVFYIYWHSMLQRCYDEKFRKRQPAYVGAYVCEEWKSLTSFKHWFDEHYVDGWQLDKDILSNGIKVYSPETCCFVPRAINNFFTNLSSHTSSLPIGVHKTFRSSTYFAQLSMFGKVRYLGSFRTLSDAEKRYKQGRESYARELAERYKDNLDPRVYDKLMNYKEI